MYFRPPETGQTAYEIPFEIGNVTILDLARAFEKLLTKAEPNAITPLGKPKRSIAEQMKVVLKALQKDWLTLEDLVVAPFTREEAVYWFLSLLELIRLGQARVKIAGEDVAFCRAA